MCSSSQLLTADTADPERIDYRSVSSKSIVALIDWAIDYGVYVTVRNLGGFQNILHIINVVRTVKYAKHYFNLTITNRKFNTSFYNLSYERQQRNEVLQICKLDSSCAMMLEPAEDTRLQERENDGLLTRANLEFR